MSELARQKEKIKDLQEDLLNQREEFTKKYVELLKEETCNIQRGMLADNVRVEKDDIKTAEIAVIGTAQIQKSDKVTDLEKTVDDVQKCLKYLKK